MKIMLNQSTLIDLLRYQSVTNGSKVAYTFLADGEIETASLTYEVLDQQAQAISAHLQSLSRNGERAILMYPAGLEFLSAFFGCLYAGIIAIPSPPPEASRLKRTLPRLQAIAKDAQATIVLTNSSILSMLEEYLSQIPEFQAMHWLDTEKLPTEPDKQWQPPAIESNHLAYLQYTSGSTSTPKGVMLSHANVMHHLQTLQTSCGYNSDSKTVTWMPNFHDYGLVEGLLEPLYNGTLCYVISPFSFLKHPFNWLLCLSRYQATHSQAPNFAYDQCLRRLNPQQINQLDLSNWHSAGNAAEPINPVVLEKFSQTFAPCGFQSESFSPAYGLAEATLLVSSSPQGKKPVIGQFQGNALEQNRLVEVTSQALNQRTVVGCGCLVGQVKVAIVNPMTLTHCAPDEIGEIWVSDPSVAQGYWQRPDETKQTFRAYITDTQEGPFLRTGDLGFMKNDELFIAGRLKDVIIIRGTNHYPQDIEWTVQRTHEALRPEHGAAFSIEVNGEEKLVIVQEVERNTLPALDVEALIETIRSSIAEDYDLSVYAILLVKRGTIKKTASGKIQRRACRSQFLDGTLDPLITWTAPEIPQQNGFVKTAAPIMPLLTNSQQCANDLIGWLRQYAQERINSRLIDERRCVPPYIILDFGNQGIMGMQIPENYGGLGLGHRDFLRVLEQMAAIDLTLASLVFLNNTNGIRPILNYATPAMKDQLLPILAKGRELSAFGLTEPIAGSNVAGISSVAIPESDNQWRIRGIKRWNSSSWAGIISIFVRLQEKNSENGAITGFVVRQGMPGVRVGPEALTMGVRGIVQNTLYLEDVRVNEANLLGELGKGMSIADETLMLGRISTATVSLGAMKRCLQLMLRYASRRNVATGRLLDSPITLNRLAQLTVKTTVIETLLNLLGNWLDNGVTLPIETAIIAKIAATEYGWDAADDLMQLLGGRGYMENNIAPQILRDMRMLRIGEGPNEALNLFLGRSATHTDTLSQFLSEHLEAAKLAQLLKACAGQIQERCLALTDTFGARSAALSWTHALVGQIATNTLLLAAVQYAALRTTNPSLERAVTWMQIQFEENIRQALNDKPTAAIRHSAQETIDLISSYNEAIGDLEQRLPGEENTLDPLLQRDWKDKNPKINDLPGSVIPQSEISELSRSEKQALLTQLLNRKKEKHL